MHGHFAAAASLWMGPSFVPTRLSGCVLWLRGDAGLTKSGNAITAWADQSASGLSFAGTATWASTGGPQSQSTVTFNGTSDVLVTGNTSPALGPGSEWFFVARFLTGVSANTGLMSMAASGQNDFGTATSLTVNAGTVPGISFRYVTNAWPNNENLTSTVNSYHRWEWEIGTGSPNPVITCLDNGTSLGTNSATAGANTIASGNRIALGARLLPNASSFGKCEIAEVVCVNRPCTAQERAALRAYLFRRYGL